MAEEQAHKGHEEKVNSQGNNVLSIKKELDELHEERGAHERDEEVFVHCDFHYKEGRRKCEVVEKSNRSLLLFVFLF